MIDEISHRGLWEWIRSLYKVSWSIKHKICKVMYLNIHFLVCPYVLWTWWRDSVWACPFSINSDKTLKWGLWWWDRPSTKRLDHRILNVQWWCIQMPSFHYVHMCLAIPYWCQMGMKLCIGIYSNGLDPCVKFYSHMCIDGYGEKRVFGCTTLNIWQTCKAVYLNTLVSLRARVHWAWWKECVWTHHLCMLGN